MLRLLLEQTQDWNVEYRAFSGNTSRQLSSGLIGRGTFS